MGVASRGGVSDAGSWNAGLNPGPGDRLCSGESRTFDRVSDLRRKIRWPRPDGAQFTFPLDGEAAANHDLEGGNGPKRGRRTGQPSSSCCRPPKSGTGTVGKPVAGLCSDSCGGLPEEPGRWFP